jgi:septum formation protein
VLQLQSGTTSLVHSGLSVISSTGKAVSDLNTSSVTFKRLSAEEMEWWIGTGLWKDRSGSFQIDGPGQLMIEKIEGDWSGIVGLPVFLLGELLRQAGEPVLP